MPLDPQKAKFAIIIGAMKSGTSSLFNYLAEHPQISPSRIKEPGFFAHDEEWQRGLSWYERLWRFDDTRHIYAMEASTEYSVAPRFPETVERMASLGTSRFKFIYVMRHPLRRIESHARQAAFTGWITESDQRSDENGFGLPHDHPSYGHAINITRYADQLDRYLARFSRDQICLLTFEELRDRPQEVLNRVCDFLEIERVTFSQTDKVHNPSRNYAPHPLWSKLLRKRLLKRAITQLIPASSRDRLRKIGAQPLETRFELSAEEEARVLAELRPDLRRLESVYGVDVKGAWGISLDEN